MRNKYVRIFSLRVRNKYVKFFSLRSICLLVDIVIESFRPSTPNSSPGHEGYRCANLHRVLLANNRVDWGVCGSDGTPYGQVFTQSISAVTAWRSAIALLRVLLSPQHVLQTAFKRSIQGIYKRIDAQTDGGQTDGGQTDGGQTADIQTADRQTDGGRSKVSDSHRQTFETLRLTRVWLSHTILFIYAWW